VIPYGHISGFSITGAAGIQTVLIHGQLPAQFFAVAGTVNKRKAIAVIMVWVKDRFSCIADK